MSGWRFSFSAVVRVVALFRFAELASNDEDVLSMALGALGLGISQDGAS